MADPRLAALHDTLEADRPDVDAYAAIVELDGGDVLVSDSTLCFRDRAELVEALERAGLTVAEVRDAPDRPGVEFISLARRSDSGPSSS